MIGRVWEMNGGVKDAEGGERRKDESRTEEHKVSEGKERVKREEKDRERMGRR